MNLLQCLEVNYGWEDTGTPDDLTVRLELDRTSHEFYPATREMVLFYDVIRNSREANFGIGTADLLEITYPHENSDIVKVNLAPVHVYVDRQDLLESLKSLLADVFKAKSQISTSKERETGLEDIQEYINAHDGHTDVTMLYGMVTGMD